MRAGSIRIIVGAAAIVLAWLVGVTWSAAGTQVSGRRSMVSGNLSNQQAKRRPALSLFDGHSLALGGGQATSAATPLLAEQAFKNIQALKGISVDDFMGTMGIMSAALGFDCAECTTRRAPTKSIGRPILRER